MRENTTSPAIRLSPPRLPRPVAERPAARRRRRPGPCGAGGTFVRAVLPRQRDGARLPAVVVSAACGLAFAALAIWISRNGQRAGHRPAPAPMGADAAARVEHRCREDGALARGTHVVLPALAVIGMLAARGRSALGRLAAGLCLAACRAPACSRRTRSTRSSAHSPAGSGLGRERGRSFIPVRPYDRRDTGAITVVWALGPWL